MISFYLKGSLAILNGFFGSGAGPILLDDVKCTGNESELIECFSVQYLGQHDCKKGDVAGVMCPGM